jgi:hypothetical protein
MLVDGWSFDRAYAEMIAHGHSPSGWLGSWGAVLKELESKCDPPGRSYGTIHRRPRRRFSAEEKVRIVLEGLRGEESVAELCRREGLAPNLDYRWSKEFLEAGKKRLLGDTTREATAVLISGHLWRVPSASIYAVFVQTDMRCARCSGLTRSQAF